MQPWLRDTVLDHLKSSLPYKNHTGRKSAIICITLKMQSLENYGIMKSMELGLPDLGKKKKGHRARFEFQINNQCVAKHLLLIC